MDIYHPSQHEADISYLIEYFACAIRLFNESCMSFRHHLIFGDNIPYDLDMYINDDPRWSYLIPPYRRVHSPGFIEARCCLKDDESGRGSER